MSSAYNLIQDGAFIQDNLLLEQNLSVRKVIEMTRDRIHQKHRFIQKRIILPQYIFQSRNKFELKMKLAEIKSLTICPSQWGIKN